jgi:hypothetical protein
MTQSPNSGIAVSCWVQVCQLATACGIYRADQVGLSGSAEMLIPKSINRLRLSGSCFRYVHGGASLQESCCAGDQHQ